MTSRTASELVKDLEDAQIELRTAIPILIEDGNACGESIPYWAGVVDHHLTSILETVSQLRKLSTNDGAPPVVDEQPQPAVEEQPKREAPEAVRRDRPASVANTYVEPIPLLMRALLAAVTDELRRLYTAEQALDQFALVAKMFGTKTSASEPPVSLKVSEVSDTQMGAIVGEIVRRVIQKG